MYLDNWKSYEIAMKEGNFDLAIKLSKKIKEENPSNLSLNVFYTNAINEKELKENKLTDKPIKILKDKLNKGFDKNDDMKIAIVKYLIDRNEIDEAENVLCSIMFDKGVVVDKNVFNYYNGLIGLKKNDYGRAKRAFSNSNIVPSYLKLYEIAIKENNNDDINKYFKLIISSKECKSRQNMFLMDGMRLSKSCSFDLAKFRYACSFIIDDLPNNLDEIEKLFISKSYDEILLQFKNKNENDFLCFIKMLNNVKNNELIEFNNNYNNISQDLLKVKILKELLIGSSSNLDVKLYKFLRYTFDKEFEPNLHMQILDAKDARLNFKTEDALKKINAILAKNPNDRYALLEKSKILSQLNCFTQAKDILDKLCEKDFDYAYLDLIEYYINIGEFKMAKELLKPKYSSGIIYKEKMIELCLYEKEYNKVNKIINEVLKEDITNFEKIMLYKQKTILFMKQKDYKSAKYYCMEAMNLLENADLSKNFRDSLFFINYNLGENVEPLYYSYFQNQLVNYNKNNTLEHINKHFSSNEYKLVHTMFNNEINSDILYNDILSRINIYCPCISDLTSDKYLIELPYEVALIDGIKTNYVNAVTISGTNKILTSYPALVKKSVSKK